MGQRKEGRWTKHQGPAGRTAGMRKRVEGQQQEQQRVHRGEACGGWRRRHLSASQRRMLWCVHNGVPSASVPVGTQGIAGAAGARRSMQARCSAVHAVQQAQARRHAGTLCRGPHKYSIQTGESAD